MQPEFYRPSLNLSGPAYSPWFKLLATLLTFGMVGYGASFALRYPLSAYGGSVVALMLMALVLLLLSYYGFLHATISMDERGITQRGLLNKQVMWQEIRSAKLIGIPRAGWLSPPRLVIRTGNAFYTFNGGTEALLAEFARISLAYEMKP